MPNRGKIINDVGLWNALNNLLKHQLDSNAITFTNLDKFVSYDSNNNTVEHKEKLLQILKTLQTKTKDDLYNVTASRVLQGNSTVNNIINYLESLQPAEPLVRLDEAGTSQIPVLQQIGPQTFFQHVLDDIDISVKNYDATLSHDSIVKKEFQKNVVQNVEKQSEVFSKLDETVLTKLASILTDQDGLQWRNYVLGPQLGLLKIPVNAAYFGNEPIYFYLVKIQTLAHDWFVPGSFAQIEEIQSPDRINSYSNNGKQFYYLTINDITENAIIFNERMRTGAPITFAISPDPGYKHSVLDWFSLFKEDFARMDPDLIDIEHRLYKKTITIDLQSIGQIIEGHTQVPPESLNPARAFISCADTYHDFAKTSTGHDFIHSFYRSIIDTTVPDGLRGIFATYNPEKERAIYEKLETIHSIYTTVKKYIDGSKEFVYVMDNAAMSGIERERVYGINLGHPENDSGIYKQGLRINAIMRRQDNTYGAQDVDATPQRWLEVYLLKFYGVVLSLEINASANLGSTEPDDPLYLFFQNSTAAFFDANRRGEITNDKSASMSKENKELFAFEQITALGKGTFKLNGNTSYVSVRSPIEIVPFSISNRNCTVNNLAIRTNLESKYKSGIDTIVSGCPELNQLFDKVNEKFKANALNFKAIALTDWKRAGDMLQVSMAFKNSKIFVTGDLPAFAYAILTGCPAILTGRKKIIDKRDEYLILMYKPYIFVAQGGGGDKDRAQSKPKQLSFKKAPVDTGAVLGKINSLFLKDFVSFKDLQIGTTYTNIQPTNRSFYVIGKTMAPFNPHVQDISIEFEKLDRKKLMNRLLCFLSKNGLTIMGYNPRDIYIDEEATPSMVAEFLMEASTDMYRPLMLEFISFYKDKTCNKRRTSSPKKRTALTYVLKLYLFDVFQFRYGVATSYDYVAKMYAYLVVSREGGELKLVEPPAKPLRKQPELPSGISHPPFGIKPEEQFRPPEIQRMHPFGTKSIRPQSGVPRSQFGTKSIRPQPGIQSRPQSRIQPRLQSSLLKGGDNTIHDYEKDLVKLYKRYLRLVDSGKPEDELQDEFNKLEKGIQKLSYKIDLHTKK